MDKLIADTLVIKTNDPVEIACILHEVSAAYNLKYNSKIALPIAFFDRNETQIRKWMHANSRRAFYRGPRVSNNCSFLQKPTMTRRCDAVAVVFGHK